jgi:hypoxia up-regulated 1
MFVQDALANLIGIDFGSSFIKATLVRPGKKFEIVENTAGGRKTETMLTLGTENRLYGADAFLESGKQPKTTFAEFQRTFGRQFDSDWVAKF